MIAPFGPGAVVPATWPVSAPLTVGSTSRSVPDPSPSRMPNATTLPSTPPWPNATESGAGTNASPPCWFQASQLPCTLPLLLMFTKKPSSAQLITPMASSPDPEGSHANAVGGVCDPSGVAMPPKVSVSCGEFGLLTL